MENIFKEQLSLEEDAINEAVKQYSDYMSNSKIKLPPEFALLKKVIPAYIAGVDEYKKPGKGKKQTPHREMICSIPSKDMAFIVLNAVISRSVDKRANVPIQNLTVKVGAELIDHIDYMKFKTFCKEHDLKDLQYIQKNSLQLPSWKVRMQVRKAMIEHGVYEPTTQLNVQKADEVLRTIPEDQFSEMDMFQVGSIAVDILLTSTNMFELADGRSMKRNTCSYIKPSEEAEKWINDIHTMSAIARPKYLPCVIPPKEWKDLVDGGYYLKRGKSALTLLRTRNKINFEVNADRDLTDVLSAINSIQNTPWQINTKVLEVMEACQDLFPDPNAIYVPELMADSTEDIERLKLQMPETMRRHWRDRMTAIDEVTRTKSQLFAAKQSVNIAQKMCAYPKLYFPHTLDYRGRAYPVPSYLNPQGDDVAKGLLMFADGKPLGDSGAYWLAVHGANCWGNNVDKATFGERVAWVEANTQAILESAAAPKSGGFWTGAEDCWQFLAFCFEWARHTEPGFKSFLSVDIDGSCNGLQHLSMMLKDEVGGALVNLLPSETPSDVYTSVKDYANGIIQRESDSNDNARRWLSLVDRKMVKRPTMTQGYGVTPSGIRQQLKDQIKKRGKEYRDIRSNLLDSVDYLSNIVDGTIKEIMPGVATIKEKLREVAALFVKANKPIRWVTPVGLEVVQQKFKQKQIRVESFRGLAKIRGGHKAVRCTLNQDTDTFDRAEQMNSLVPNVIHSFDAAHMMHVVNECGRRGIDYFHAIHDSFGTHACDVEELHEVIREEFVAMYSGDTFADLLKQFAAQLPDACMPEAPKLGNLDPYSVLESDYFFG